MKTKRVARMGSGPEIGNDLEKRCIRSSNSTGGILKDGNGYVNMGPKRNHGSASSRKAVADRKTMKTSADGRGRPGTIGSSSWTAPHRAKENVKSSTQPSADTEPVLVYLSDDSADGNNKRRRTAKDKTLVKEYPNKSVADKLRKANLRAFVERRFRKRSETALSQANFARKVAEKKLSSCQNYIKVLLGQMEKQLACAEKQKTGQEELMKAQVKMVDTCTSEYNQAIRFAKENGLQL